MTDKWQNRRPNSWCTRCGQHVMAVKDTRMTGATMIWYCPDCGGEAMAGWRHAWEVRQAANR